MKFKWNKKFITVFVVGLLLWVTAFSLYHFKINTTFNSSSVKQFEKKFQQKEKLLHQNINQLSGEINKTNSLNEIYTLATKLSESKKLDVFIYKKDSLIVWTNNQIPIIENSELDNEAVIHLSNGWYYFYKTKLENYTIYGVFLIKSSFIYENEDLKNTFSDDFKNIINGKIVSLENSKYKVKNDENIAVFGIVPLTDYKSNEPIEIVIFIGYIISFFIFLQLLISASQVLLIKNPYLLIVYPIVIIGVRYLSLKYNWLSFLSDFNLFNPGLFASSSVPSLGDLVINVMIFYFLVHFLIKRTKNWFKVGNKKLKLVLFLIPLFLISFYVAYKINDLIYSLVYDSKINFNLEQLFDLNFYSFLSIFIIGACFYAYFKFVQFIITSLKKNEFEWNRLAFLWVLSTAVYIIIDFYNLQHSLLTSIWPLILSGALLWFEFKNKAYKFIHVMSVLAFTSFYAAYILQDYANLKEKKTRQYYAEQIATDEDPVSEFEFDNIYKKLNKSDYLLHTISHQIHEADFNDSIENYYFKKLKNKFDLNFHLFNSQKVRVINYSDAGTIPYSDLHNIALNSGKKSSINSKIFFIDNYTEKLSYIIDYPIIKNDSIFGYFIVEMRSKKFPIDIGLPSLLLEKGSKSIKELKNYSIAKYIDNVLISHKGEYNFPFEPANWIISAKGFTNKDGFSHYIYQIDKHKYTILSKKETNIVSLITAFSYLLIIYGFFLLFPLAYQHFKNKTLSLKNISLNVRIQTVLIGLILLSLITFGIGAGTYVIKQYHISSKGFIKEKTISVKTELQHKLGGEKELESDLVYLEYLLKKFSRVFVTDINLYDTNGDLLASSQPKIYSKGLISKKMNPISFQEIKLLKKSEFIHQENIGELNYLSSYVPFVSNDGKLLAYLNLQYISKQDELENQISGFLLAIINIMVLMLTIAIIIAITVSNRLTSPLKYIQESLNKVQFGTTNKTIEYDGSDEIGDLVQEYNRKVAELQESATQLAKSERESAWREMAKQVAHEIKNPLTPMKLSIQHMKRSLEVKDEAAQIKLNKVTASLIEQIDALTKIANEFSNFAKMPKAVEERVNLVVIVENAYSVFSKSSEYQIEFNNLIGDEAIIWADKTLCLRVFNNLIKNAIQAIPQTEEGLLKIFLSEEDDHYLVEIRDNGIGISEDQAEKIFVPYFTTKSTGTGLGLAMSKQIIENMHGTISFKTKPNIGTSFFVTFPKIKIN